jgi:glycosyltransferase involved in cell wall biosynthesis
MRPPTPTIAIVNASGKTDGISLDGLAFRTALTELGYGVSWYQCLDRGVQSPLSNPDHVVRGLGFPNQTVDMGINRLWTFPDRLRRIPSDIVFLMDPTLVNAARFHPRCAIRVHDLKPLTRFADRRASTWMFHYAIPRLRLAQRVFVPTESMATEVTQQGVSPEQVRVVPETHSLGFHPEHVSASLERIRATGKVRVLCVSTDRPYKNLEFVVRLAQDSARGKDADRIQFTILSRLRSKTRALVSQMNLPNLTTISEVASIDQVYETNDVLVHPSLHEGFGRPVIEAMAFGLPVLASNIAPLAEIVGDSGSLFEPTDTGPWLAALASLSGPAAYQAAAERSLRRGERFSPAAFRESVERAFRDL